MMINNIDDSLKYYDIAMKRKNVKQTLRGTLEYKKWIILWDLVNTDYYHIAHDIRTGKITIDDVKDVIYRGNCIENIFDEDFIMEMVVGL